MDYFQYSPGEFIPSEISGKPADDIHHIDCRGMGGSKNKDSIDNLIALTREEHEKYGDKKQYLNWLKHIHQIFMFNRIK